MSYPDPYHPPEPRPYSEQGGYQDNVEYNPYEQQPRYPTYEQQPYTDNPQPGYDSAGYADAPSGYGKDYDAAGRLPTGAPPKSTGMLRIWRRDMRGKQWARGGGWRSCCRFFCCFLMTFIFLLISIVLALALFIRPPDVTFNGVNIPSNGSVLQVEGPGSFVISLELNIGVRNPNYFSVDFSSVNAQIFYPGHSGQIGDGVINNLVFGTNTATTFLFPITINYTTAADPGLEIISDLAQKCGFEGSSTSDITVNFNLALALKILAATVTPTVSSSASFACPLTEAQITSIFGSILNGGGLGSL